MMNRDTFRGVILGMIIMALMSCFAMYTWGISNRGKATELRVTNIEKFLQQAIQNGQQAQKQPETK
jgi:hypothetical protein